MLMVAIGHQAGLAIENTVFYQDKLQAERLAAVYSTVADLEVAIVGQESASHEYKAESGGTDQLDEWSKGCLSSNGRRHCGPIL